MEEMRLVTPSMRPRVGVATVVCRVDELQRRFLLVRQTSLSCWTLPGGLVRLGEPVLTAAQRTLQQTCDFGTCLRWHSSPITVTDSVGLCPSGQDADVHDVVAQCFAWHEAASATSSVSHERSWVTVQELEQQAVGKGLAFAKQVVGVVRLADMLIVGRVV